MSKSLKTLFYLFISARPSQWLKNLIIFAPLIFSQRLFIPYLVGKTLVGFIIFCLTSSLLYLLNDLLDYQQDKIHPVKRKRPIPAGLIERKLVWRFILIFSPLVLIASFFLTPLFGLINLAYSSLILSYSFYLKHIVLLDLFIIAGGFVLRCLAGVVLVRGEISPWLLLCTIFLALFLIIGKRRNEISLLKENAASHRVTLAEYNPLFLDQLVAIVTGCLILSYCLYTISSQTITKLKTPHLKYTIPFVLFGIFRYLYLIYQKEKGGRPEKILLTDLPLLINVGLWGISVCLILYWR
jgi:4-hydroxybenzoate polyprenyltransferase